MRAVVLRWAICAGFCSALFVLKYHHSPRLLYNTLGVGKSVVEKFWRRVGEECCREVVEKSVVEKKKRVVVSFGEGRCGAALERVVQKCWRRAL